MKFVLAMGIALLFAGCASSQQPQPSACACKDCKCAHCADAKAGKAPAGTCACGAKKDAPVQPAACNCGKTMTGCKCQHCADAKAGKTPSTPCDCADKKKGSCGGGG